MMERAGGRSRGGNPGKVNETERPRHHRDPEERQVTAVRSHAATFDGSRGEPHELVGGIARHRAAPVERLPCSRANTEGTKTRVATVAHSRPPITARPSGAFCSPPSPSPSAMGTIPMIMARAVMRTGRKRV